MPWRKLPNRSDEYRARAVEARAKADSSVEKALRDAVSLATTTHENPITHASIHPVTAASGAVTEVLHSLRGQNQMLTIPRHAQAIGLVTLRYRPV